MRLSPKAEGQESGLRDGEAGPVIVFGTPASVICGVIPMLLQQKEGPQAHSSCENAKIPPHGGIFSARGNNLPRRSVL